METWYKVELSVADIRNRKGVLLQDEFTALFRANGAPKDAAMFDKVDDTPPFTCFFTPGAYRMAELMLRDYGATECNKPLVHEVVLVVGNSDAMRFFFAFSLMSQN